MALEFIDLSKGLGAETEDRRADCGPYRSLWSEQDELPSLLKTLMEEYPLRDDAPHRHTAQLVHHETAQVTQIPDEDLA